MKQVLIAWLAAIPFAYVVMIKWLSSFEFQIAMPFDAYILAGLVAIVIALATVSYRSVKASLMDPSTTLRYE